VIFKVAGECSTPSRFDRFNCTSVVAEEYARGTLESPIPIDDASRLVTESGGACIVAFLVRHNSIVEN
jgi:hypothetical protein